MASYIDAVKDAVGSAFCAVADVFDRASSKAFGTSPGAIKGTACDDPEPPPPLPPPFDGGQCEGIEYRVALDLGGTGETLVTQLFGPITALAWQVEEDLPNGDQRGRFIRAGRNASGEPVSFNSERTYGAGQLPVTTVGPERVDGLPDDCGDPPPPPPPDIDPEPQPITVVYINNEGDEITELGDLTIFAPVLVAPFTLVAPVRVDLGGIELSGNIQFSPEFDITIAPNIGGEGGDTGVPEPIEPEPEDPPEDDPDEPVECVDKPITGLVVDLLFSETMLATELAQDNPIPAIGVPRVAILYFVALVGNRQVWMPGVDLKSRSQFVPVPYNALVICWRIHTEPGVVIQSTRPIFATP